MKKRKMLQQQPRKLERDDSNWHTESYHIMGNIVLGQGKRAGVTGMEIEQESRG